MEDEINSLYKVIDDANLTKMDLESQIESMKEELTLLSKNHEEVSAGWGACPAPCASRSRLASPRGAKLCGPRCLGGSPHTCPLLSSLLMKALASQA